MYFLFFFPRKVNQQLRNEMEQRSIRELSLNEQLFDLRQKTKVLRAQSMKDTATITELRLIMDDIKNKGMRVWFSNHFFLSFVYFFSVLENIAEPINLKNARKEVRMIE